MQVHEQLVELKRVVERARAMPMSASCVINRAEVLALIEAVEKTLPAEISDAQRVLKERDAVIEEGRAQAKRSVDEGVAERESLSSRSQVSLEGRKQAGEIIEQARAEAEQLRAEVDEYVDSKLANFEAVLSKTLNAVVRGRDRLRGESDLSELSSDNSPR